MANIITVARFPLLVLIVILLTIPSAGARTVAVPLVLVLILLDTVDGIVARARKEESLLGSVLDIMADRSVEMVLWVVYAHLDPGDLYHSRNRGGLVAGRGRERRQDAVRLNDFSNRSLSRWQ
jgi:phosphatidylglycerophosphate synthase